MGVTIADVMVQLAYPGGINDAGQVVGLAPLNGGQPFLWQNGKTTYLGPILGYSYSEANAINALGQVAADYATGNFDLLHAALWQNGTATALGSLSIYSQANAINDVGQVVGVSGATTGVDDAFLWQNGKMTDLGTLPGVASTPSWAFHSEANGINNAGQIVGLSLNALGDDHAVMWQNGTITDLGVLPGCSSSVALAINGKAQVVGFSTLMTGYNSWADHAALWQNGTATDLGTLPGFDSSHATAIDAAGDIVGWAGISSQSADAEHAVMWQNGKIVDLNTLLPVDSGWLLYTASGINDNGQIIGTGSHYGTQTGFVLSLNGSTAIVPDTVQQAIQHSQGGAGTSAVPVADTMANIQANLDTLQTLASAHEVSSLAATGSGTPVLTITAAQMVSDRLALGLLSGQFAVSVDAAAANATVDGLAGHANTVVFTGAASEYTIAAPGDGTSVVVTDVGTGRTSTDHLSNVSALQFSDHTDIVASQTPPAANAVSSAQVTELYSAVFGRTPDVAGLAFYQNYAASSPSTPFTQFAQWFLASPEYAGNAAHNYAQTSAGDAQFITDSYGNLLHRAPASGDAAWYQTNVINPMLAGLTPGTAAYSSAEAQAHAQVLAYFSQSPEFLADVTVTAQNPTNAQHWLVLV